MPIPNKLITLLTDFGDEDGFVGTMKGVILNIHPPARIVDISHKIPPQDVDSGAFILRNSYRFFPDGTIHLAIVDPGVGSKRRILIAETERYLFIAPDNSLLKYIFHENHVLRVFEAENHNYFLNKISHTFHGRDIFAPIAAHLASDIVPEQFGRQISDYDRGRISIPIIKKHQIRGNVIHIDHFGNLITNIPSTQLKNKRILSIKIGTNTIEKLSNSYAEVAEGELIALPGSAGFLEIAIRDGNAGEVLHMQRNDEIIVVTE